MVWNADIYSEVRSARNRTWAVETEVRAAGLITKRNSTWIQVIGDRVVVLTEGNRIAAVGPASSVSAPADATVIDLPGATLLPGLN